MNKFLIPGLVVVVLLIAGVVYSKRSTAVVGTQASASSSPTAAMAHDAMSPDSTMAMAMKKDAGATFIPFTSEADAQKLVSVDGKDVVYFFDASWCPDCQAIQKQLETSVGLSKIGKNTVVIKVDYDKETALKRKYAITHQTAFVRIDGSGGVIKQAILPTYSDVQTF